MSKVYFLENFKKLNVATKKLLSGFYPKKSNLLVKIHFGEPGNKLALFPKDVQAILDVFKSSRIQVTLVDTPVAYSSPRDTVNGYKRAAKGRGWEKVGKILISNKFKKVKTRDFTTEVCQELVEAKNVLVISHVKGHACSGFGGAIKNLGMGGVSAKTKVVEHNLCKPHYVAECQGCEICSRVCPAGAIKMKNGKAKLNNNACWGCSICQLECPHNCLAPQKATFDDLLAQGASVVVNNLPKRTYYINLVKNITKRCDCEVNSGEIIAKKVGALFSDNPVAIDKASVDLVRKMNKKKPFLETNHKDPLLHVNFTSKYTSWKANYKLSTL